MATVNLLEELGLLKPGETVVDDERAQCLLMAEHALWEIQQTRGMSTFAQRIRAWKRLTFGCRDVFFSATLGRPYTAVALSWLGRWRGKRLRRG